MTTHNTHFDVIVIGGGHAGVEAAHAAATMGSKTLLVTLDVERIGVMPCNPAVGGIGKGHIVYEISALGGLMPKLCTSTYLQVRMLNTRKGPAVQGLRLQIDKHAYNKLSVATLKKLPNLTLLGAAVDSVILDEQGRVCGVVTDTNQTFQTSTVIITTGTFLNGITHVGPQKASAGRSGERAVTTLAQFLHSLNLEMGRLKTGTPPRLLRSSLDFSKMQEQAPDNLEYLFEFTPHKSTSSRACYITHTNETTHQIIRDNIHLSAAFNGGIQGKPPRYCPSIEDKINRFSDKTSHHVFVEPESADCDEIYPNGLSTALPLEVQEKYIRSIAGFENAIIARPGYAVEYDFVLPHQLHHTLELKKVPGLFLAGQINGTTGYEEAAGQGIIAGINASQKAHNKPPFVLDRSESYIGVMIDDLVTMSVDEPYRMFTSRAERRLIMRQDNSFARLSPYAYELGMITKEEFDAVLAEKELVDATVAELRSKYRAGELAQMLNDMSFDIAALRELVGKHLPERTLTTVYAEIMYEPYIKRELKEVEKHQQFKSLVIPETFDFQAMPGLSKELQQKLAKHKPGTIGQADLIPGMTPAALSLLIFRVRAATNK